MTELIRPAREPDFEIDYISFWWRERLQRNGARIFRINPNNWTFEFGGRWFAYDSPMWSDQLDKMKSSYAKWL